MPARPILAIPLALLTLASCAHDAPDRRARADADRAASTVRIGRSRFSQPQLSVASGTTVVFVNDDPFTHTVTALDDAPVAFDSGELGEGERFAVTFDESGTYVYFCEIHPTMRARVVVT